MTRGLTGMISTSDTHEAGSWNRRRLHQGCTNLTGFVRTCQGQWLEILKAEVILTGRMVKWNGDTPTLLG